jgi:membrane protease YdiL (CAAX protease family)
MTAGGVADESSLHSVLVMNTASTSSTSTSSSRLAPRLGSGPLGIAVRVVAMIALLIAANAAAAALTVIPVVADVLDDSPPTNVLWSAVRALVLGIVVLGAWAWMRWIERAPMRAAGWRWGRRSAAWLLLGVVVTTVIGFAVVALLPATGPVLGLESLLDGQTATPFVLALLVVNLLGGAFVQQGIPEELMFRGMLLWRLRERPVLAVAVSTLAFAAIHLISNGGQQSAWEHVLYLVEPFGFALLAAGLLLWTGSLWAAIGVHGGSHVGTYLAEAFLPQVDAVTSWLLIGGAESAVGLALVVTALRRGKRILDGES